MSQLNLLRYLWLYILVPGIVLALSTSADAQNSYSCDIRSNDVIRTLSTRRVAQNAISVSRGGYSPWNITENELLEDNRHIAIDIDPHLSTEALRFNNFNFDLPENVSITGIEVIITGDSESDTPLWEQDIRLIGSGGNTVGDNKANKELAGDAWNLDTLSSLGYWTYGSSVDLWGSNWSPSDINNNNFGFSLQTKNRSDEIASLSIDQLIIVVYYDNPIIICQAHACIVVTVEADESVVSYNWNVRGLEWEPSNDDPNVINVIADNASFGEYEVCLDRQYDDGRQESCCRAITYQDCSTGSIGDFVWQDLNGNGFQDSGEPGLSDCNVILYTESLSYVASTQTVNGMYLFTDLDPGNYIVQVDVKDYCPTKFDGSNTTLNSDFYNAFLPNSSHVVSLAANEDRRDIDFGLIRKGSVEGLTWIDKNDNGLYEDTDCPIADIKVSIVNTDGDTVRCVISGADGTYVADNVPPGEYTVKFAFPQEYLVTSRGVDSHTLPGHCSEAVTVGENVTTTVNAGAFRPSTLGNYVWLDSNENGIQDTDEPGIAGAVITLTSCDDIFIGEYQTDANGNYQISDIAPGTYKICVDPMRDDLEATLSNIGDDILDSDHVAGTACTACITVGENANDQTYDFGFIESEVLSKIDVYVFEDVNNDGVNDANDPPIPNVKVEIYDCNGSLIADLTTDNVGAVWQMDIPIGNYYIKVTPPLGYTIRPGGLITGANGRGTTDCLSSAPMGFSLEIPLIRNIPNVTISVYDDIDGDGVNGPNHPPLSSISIDIYTCDGVLVANTTTDALGIVLQTLPEGNYYYRIYPPNGYVLGFDSIIDGSNGTDTTPCLPTGPDGISIEIGLVESNAQIDVYVYHDVDNNGTNDPNDPDLPNVGVEIYNCSTGLISSMSTNNLGAVWQYNIENGDYYIKIIPPAGYTIRPGGIISNANGPGTTDCYNSAPIGFSIEVGLILQGDPNVTISVYEDTDGDGVNGPNDPPLSSISIDIYTCDGVLVANTTTDALGIVLQTLPEGNYYYRIYPPSGYVLGFDSIIDGSNGTDTTPCLPTGPDGISIEIGLVESNAQIDVYVYHDVDDNGTNDPNDPALPNVGVEIYNCSTGLISSMSTNNLGAVWQYNIENGDYYIKIIPPAGYTIRPGGIITNANGPGTTDCYNSAPIGFSIEVGLILQGDPNVTISVYEDTDGDGVNGPNDPPLSSISIDIYTCDGVLVANTTTDALGIVLQTLPEGNYYYRIYPPNGYVLGFDSIIDGSNGTDTTPCLPTGPDGISIEIGLVESNAQIDVYVYHDVDDNGTNDSNDPALPNVGVEIYNCATGLISSMSTNNLGAVWQYNIENGDYYIKIIPPAGYTIRPGGIITDANGPGTTDCLNSAPIGFSIEVGLILQGDPNVTISVYEDTDGDGVNGPNDPPLSSISIDIYTCDGVLVANTTTDALGIVLQTLPEGNYYYRIYPPSGYVLGFDSIIDGSNGTDTTPCLPTGPDGLSIEIGLVESNAQIDVYVYHDVEDNGTNDSNDPALPNVGVEIYNCSTGLISSISTNNVGAVWQYNIENGDYYIKIIPPAGYTIRPGGIITDANGPGTTDCLNSAPIGFSIEVGLILLGDPNVTVSVYDDTDGDGVNGPNDPPLSSISIDIYTCDGVLVANTTTDAVGVILETLPEGNYYFRIYPPIGYVIGFGSIIDGSNGTDTTPCLPTGPDGINIEIGLVESNAQIDVYVYHDIDDNGTNDPNDPALPNVGVEIHNCTTGLISSMSTNNVGAVWQYNIENGDYYIKIIPPAGYTIRPGGIITNANGPGTTDCLNSAPIGFSIEVGLINNTPPTGTGIITGVIWQDDDGSSTNDNEPPVSGITVSLYTCNGDFVASTETDAQGAYAFVDLLPGDYYIEVDSLPGFAFSTGADSGVDNSNGSGTTACISVDDTTVTINAGIAPLSSIGNYVWLDNNVNGIQDANESGVAGIPLVLLDDNELEIANTVTGTQGEYNFSDIAPGNYRIEIRDSRTFGVTLQSIGPEDTDSELRIEGSRLVSEYFTLSGGNDLTDIDMGLTIESAIIGGLVFQDEGLDGVLSNADDRVQDISVHLYSSAGVLTQTLITDTGGAYVFFNVIPGDYYVQFDAASDIVFTMPNIGSDELLDSDVIDTDGRTDIISVEGGDIIQGVNAGLTQTSGCISGVFWDDANRDGILGNGAGSAASENTSNQRLMEERRIDNATVNLYREDGTLVATDITDFDGQYNFCDLEVGNYYVQFTLPDNYVFTIANQGTDELLDSDVTDPVNGTTDIISVNTSNIINGISAGAYEQSTIVSGTIWEDANSDGILSALEIGISGISINLVAADGSIALTALSNQDGIYTFTDPTAGVYSLSVIVPDSLALTQSMIGADPSLYSHFSESDNSTSTFNITTGEIYNNINAGFIEKEELRPARVSGQVWLDVNRDGILQTIERGISDVTINLMEMDMTIVNTVSTGSDGEYNFTNIPSGDYILEIMNSDTYAMTTAHVGNDPTVYSHFDESSRSSDPIAVSEGDNISNMNGGLIPNIGSMSGTIWLDTDDDGKYDTDENGIQGINVNLLRADESIVSSIFTDASGAYSFTDLDAGDYILEVVSGTAYDHAKGFRGADETIYSHILMNFGRSDIKSIAAGDNLININAGLTEAQVTTSMSGTVWLDTDDDGKYDTDENGIQGINVNLLRADESIVSSIFTDTSGAYSFTNLDAGDYILEVVSGTAYDHAKGFRGADETIYSHILMNFGRSDIKSIATGDNLMNINAGLTEAQVTTSMSGTVWLDTDDDGKYDTDENGIQGINVNLLRADESIVSSIFTDASGAYSFTDLDAGDYILEVVSGTAYDHAKGFRGIDETIYSHILMNIGRSDIKSIAAGDNLININAGLTEAVNTIVSGVVWLDENKNGFLDDTELGLEAIGVELYREGGTLVASTLTAVTGRYTFDGLTAGRYYVLFNMIADHTFTIPRAGGSAPNDSNVTDFNLGTTNIFAIAKGNYFGNIHAGYIRENDPVDTVGSITGYVWEDRNGDGILEIAEGGQNDVVVILYYASGVEVARTTTSNDPDTGRPGYYDFLQIVTGSYTTEYLLDDQAQPTISGQDSALGDDMKIDGFSVSAGTQIIVNAGYYFTASIGDYVWQDANENGIQDNSETGAQNFFIKLLDTNNQQVAFTFSDSEGGYAFDNLAPGDYYIQVDFQLGISFSVGGLGDSESDSNINNDNGFGTTSTITLSSGDNNNTVDIGLIVAPATAGDRVFADTNGDGIQDDAEGGIDGIAVMLYDRNDNLIQSTETATVAGESGKYLFEDIKAGNYYIVFDIPAGLDISPQDQGGDDSKDSDVDNSQQFGSTSIFELSAGETDLDIDCGIISSLSIGDRVWHDRDSDGSFDNNEPGVSGVEVTLHDGEGNYISATTTNNQGIYSFDGLNPGDYYLQFNAPENFTYTEKGVGAPSIDSDVNEDGSSDLITLTSTSGTRKVSAGLIRPSNEIGGIAWWDNNLDGLYTTDEDLMEGVTVYLLNNNQQLLDEVQTNILGRYVFYDIPNGPYIIQFASEVDMSFTTRNVGGNDKINSAVDADGYSQIVNATGQTVERYINGGLIDIEAPGIAKVYPNPVSGNAIQLEVRSAKDTANISVYLYDMSGRLMDSWTSLQQAKAGLSKYMLPVYDLSGQYIMKVRVGNRVETKKLIILDE